MGVLEDLLSWSASNNQKLDEILGIVKGTPNVTPKEPALVKEGEVKLPIPPKAEKVKTKAKVYTIAQIKEKIKEVLEKAKLPATKELLSRFGAEKVGDVPEDKYTELYNAAEALLANLPPPEAEPEDDLGTE